MSTDLDALIKASVEAFNALPPEERERVLRAQGESMARNYKPGDRQGVYPQGSSFQDRVRAMMDEVAGDDLSDVAERRDRFGEEALELQQALGATREGMHQLVDYVFDREIGKPGQEMGGTMVTLAGLASWAVLDMAACGEAELTRCSTPEVMAKIRRKRAGRHGRGPLPGVDADLVTG